MRRVLLIALILWAVGNPGSVMACHPCVAGELCLPHGGCGGDGRGVFTILAYRNSLDRPIMALMVRVLPTRDAGIRSLLLRGRVTCCPRRPCPGRRGLLTMRGILAGGVITARFRNGGRCDFTLTSSPSGSYECRDRAGRITLAGLFRVVPPPGRPALACPLVGHDAT